MNKASLSNTDLNVAANLPFSQACENNKQAILEILQQELTDTTHVLEIGSGTGQHSVYFAPMLAHLQWQTSDVEANHWVINAWHTAYPVPNLQPPIAFNLAHDALPSSALYDAVFTANTLHIISWPLVEQLFNLVGQALPIDGKLIIYGPFNDNGNYTSVGNQQFDAKLRQDNPNSGIRDKQDIVDLAKVNALALMATYSMPANNQILVFQKN